MWAGRSSRFESGHIIRIVEWCFPPPNLSRSAYSNYKWDTRRDCFHFRMRQQWINWNCDRNPCQENKHTVTIDVTELTWCTLVHSRGRQTKFFAIGRSWTQTPRTRTHHNFVNNRHGEINKNINIFETNWVFYLEEARERWKCFFFCFFFHLVAVKRCSGRVKLIVALFWKKNTIEI